MIWPRIAGVLVALGAQGALYLALRHLATATMPAWAHHHHQAGPLPWPSVVPVDVVHGAAGRADGPAPITVPAFIAAPTIVLAPPSLGASGAVPSSAGSP